jgi:hypothetical protein
MRVLKWEVFPYQTNMIGAGKVVMVAVQNSIMCVWTEEHDQQQTSRREVVVIGTGDLIPEGHQHIGSSMTNNGATVAHVYEKVVF